MKDSLSGEQINATTHTTERWIAEDNGVFHVVSETTIKARWRDGSFHSYQEAVEHMASLA